MTALYAFSFYKKTIIYLTTFFVLFCFSINIYGVETQNPSNSFEDHLNKEEKSFLKNTNSISVALPQDWPPFQFEKDGEASGFSIELLRNITDIMDIELNIVQTDWNTAFSMINNHEVDLILDISNKNPKGQSLLYSDIYADVLTQFAVRKNDNINHFEDFENKKIGILENTRYNKALTDFFNNNDVAHVEIIEFKTIFDGLSALEKNKIDAFYDISATINYYINISFSQEIGMFNIPELNQNVLGLRVAVSNNKTVLRDVINKAMSYMSPEEKENLLSKWISNSYSFNFNNSLSLIEKEWLKKQSNLTLVYDSNSIQSPLNQYYQPKIIDNISKDYLQLVANQIGCNLIFQNPVASSSTNYGNFKVFSTVINQSNHNDLLFSNAYFDANLVIFGLNKSSYISDISQLNGKKVVVVQNSPAANWLKNGYPLINLVYADTIESALLLISQHDAAAFIDTLMNGSLVIADTGNKNIKIIGETPYNYSYGFAVSSNNAILASIINKAIESITVDQKQDIMSKWVNISYTYETDLKYFYTFGSASVFIFCLLLFRNLILANIKKQSDANMSVIDKYVLCFKFDNFGQLTYASQALCDFTGYSNSQFLNMNAYDIVLEDKLVYALHKLKTDEEWEGNLLIRDKSNSTLVCKASIAAKKIKPYVVEYTAFLYNITDSTKEIMQKEMAFLRAQIKPHFLFNTLNTILYFWKYEPDKAGNLLENFSKFLRSGFDFSDENIHVKKELEYIYSYLAIEQARFEKLSVVYDFDEDELDFSLPPFLIQPLIENAIKHGILPKREGGTVTLNIRKDVHHITITVSDDGVGMTEEKLNSLLDGENFINIDKRKQDKHVSIGFNNVRKRIENYYGYNISMNSEIDKGTKVTITIPIN